MKDQVMTQRMAMARVELIRSVNPNNLAIVQYMRPGSDTPVWGMAVVKEEEDGTTRVYPIGELYDDKMVRLAQPVDPSTGEVISLPIQEAVLAVDHSGEVVKDDVKPNPINTSWIN